MQHRGAFPDLTVYVDDLLVAGDKVVVRAHAEGTHRGEFMGMPATGAPSSASTRRDPTVIC